MKRTFYVKVLRYPSELHVISILLTEASRNRETKTLFLYFYYVHMERSLTRLCYRLTT